MKLFRCWILKYQRSKEHHSNGNSERHNRSTFSYMKSRYWSVVTRQPAAFRSSPWQVWTLNGKKSYAIDYWSSIRFWTFPGCSCISDKQQRESWGSFLRREPCKNSRTSAPAKERKHVFALRVNLTINNQLLQVWNVKMTLKTQALCFF